MRAEGAMNGKLEIAGRALASRLIVGTGKFASGDAMRAALDASGTEIVTVALRRVDLDASGGPDILEFIDRDRYLLLPNTSGARDPAEMARAFRDAVDAGRRAFEAGPAPMHDEAEASSPLTGFLDPQ